MTVPRVTFVPIVISDRNQKLIEQGVAAGQIIRADGVLYVPYGEGFAVPLSFEYEGTAPAVAWGMTVQVDPSDGRARCVRLWLDAPRGGHISGATIRRLSLPTLIEEALLLAAIPLDENGKPSGDPIGNRVQSLAEGRRTYAALLREHRGRLRRPRRPRSNRIPVEEVARVYRAEMAKARPRPTQAVADHFDIPRSTAGRWVTKTRDVNELAHAPKQGVPGERKE